jgi:cysteine desulfurase
MNNQRPNIYMDHAATTPMRPEVVEAMLPYFTEFYGNPSSIHGIGRKAHAGLDGARRIIAGILGAKTNEVIFTGCGSEGDNAALRGIALAHRQQSGANRIVTTPIEHKAVLETAYDLRDHFGFELTLVPVDHDGLVCVDDVAAALDEDVAVVSVMLANNEIGTIQPLAEIGAICRAQRIPLHTDAVQAVGKLPLAIVDLQVDALSSSAHKFYGPKGVGFLYLRQGPPSCPHLQAAAMKGDAVPVPKMWQASSAWRKPWRWPKLSARPRWRASRSCEIGSLTAFLPAWSAPGSRDHAQNDSPITPAL